MKKKYAHGSRMEKRLQLWGAKLEGIAIGAEESGLEMSLDFRHRLADLKTKFSAVKLNLDELESAGINEWEIGWVRAKSNWKEFESAFMTLTS